MAACCVATDETEYQVSVGNGTPVQLNVSALSDRKTIAYYNYGPGIVEFRSINQFTFGQGFPIPVGQPVAYAIGPGIKHYGVCAAGQTADLRVLELGAPDA